MNWSVKVCEVTYEIQSTFNALKRTCECVVLKTHDKWIEFLIVEKKLFMRILIIKQAVNINKVLSHFFGINFDSFSVYFIFFSCWMMCIYVQLVCARVYVKALLLVALANVMKYVKWAGLVSDISIVGENQWVCVWQFDIDNRLLINWQSAEKFEFTINLAF